MKCTTRSVNFDKKLLDKNALQIIKTIKKSGFEAYLVGGCVRDLLLNLKPKDFDIATSAKPEQVAKLFKRARLIGKRFRLVHVLFGARDFLEVATFRTGEVQTAQTGMIVRDNCYGTLEEDVVRRDFNINALYYDIEKSLVLDYVGGLEDIQSKTIHIIGKASERFEQDPVRMIRAVRFQTKLNFTVSPEIDKAIFEQANLLQNVSNARLYEECIKLFHNEYGLEVFERLQKYGLLQYLFKNTESNSFVKKALKNTAARIKQNKPVTPVFLFAVFLWQAQNTQFSITRKKQKSQFLAFEQASEAVIIAQIKQVSMPRWLSARVREVWALQEKLENPSPKHAEKILNKRNFRMAYDFLLLRAQSTNPELEAAADFWTKIQQ
jgi:poly(A) polymerase